MKTIGLIGGMSWESTVSYYQAINRGIKAELGGFHSAKVSLYSVDFDEIETLQRQGDWQAMAKILAKAAQAVEAGGADCLLICTNTMHRVAEDVQAVVSIPLLHIADATAKKLKSDGIKKVGLLGTQFTMEQDFYKGRLTDKHGIQVFTPDLEERELIHDIIYQELCQGKISNASRDVYVEIIDQLQQQGAQAIILGCTEIALLIQQKHTPTPLYDTTEIHAASAVEFALESAIADKSKN